MAAGTSEGRAERKQVGRPQQMVTAAVLQAGAIGNARKQESDCGVDGPRITCSCGQRASRDFSGVVLRSSLRPATSRKDYRNYCQEH